MVTETMICVPAVVQIDDPPNEHLGPPRAELAINQNCANKDFKIF